MGRDAGTPCQTSCFVFGSEGSFCGRIGMKRNPISSVRTSILYRSQFWPEAGAFYFRGDRNPVLGAGAPGWPVPNLCAAPRAEGTRTRKAGDELAPPEGLRGGVRVNEAKKDEKGEGEKNR